MRIGIVSYWFNRGQATVGRHIRSIFDAHGHQTFVLARPTEDRFTFSNFVSGEDCWQQDGVTRASAFEIPEAEYIAWVRDNGIETVFFDQNYQFAAIALLRRYGVRTIGRFVWESFAPADVQPALTAFNTIYSVTRSEQQRYHALGIDSPFVRWGCHPEVQRYRAQRVNEGRSFLYIGGFLSTRKPTLAAVRAFHALPLPEARLVIKAQRPVEPGDLVVPRTMSDLSARRRAKSGGLQELHADRRIEVDTRDLPLPSYFQQFSAMDVSLAPSRWEGLGLHLFEAQSLGIPTVSCNIAPINEVISHGRNGLLVDCTCIGQRANGLPAYEPEPAALAAALQRISDPRLAQDLAQGALARLAELSWRHTEADYLSLAAA